MAIATLVEPLDQTRHTTRPTAATRQCQHPLWGEPGGLPCVRPAGHTGGHEYHDPSGSSINDHESGHG
jgi:hypothetical protein